MPKSLIFLADGMADEPLSELDGKTPLEAVDTPNMDYIAAHGAVGEFLSLPDGFPTSSDVANMSVLGYELDKYYSGRGSLEAVSQGIEMTPDDIAWRCNLIRVEGGVLTDYSAGHIDNAASRRLMNDLQAEFGGAEFSFHPGVSYRNLLITHGAEFSDKINYHKPDSSHGKRLDELWWSPADDSAAAAATAGFIRDLTEKTAVFLAAHPLTREGSSVATHIWPWSPGRKPAMPPFTVKYAGRTGAVISAVDVIFGLGECAGMEVVKVPGATGFIDTNYAGKARAAVKALERHDFVYLHVEAIDECSHLGDLELKMRAIADFDAKIVGPVLAACRGESINFAVLPDHPVPVKLRKHTRTPVPVAACGPGIPIDGVERYSETLAPGGGLGLMRGDELMKKLLGLN